MTARVYLNDTTADECRATVLACEQTDGGYLVLLSDTVIFPESGGQLSDTGMIDGQAVHHAREKGDDVWHLVDKAVAAGSTVNVKVDMAGRLDHSQQHTGEHMVSGLASIMYGAKNVGFHMAADYSTLDLDVFLDEEQLNRLERAANAAVAQDVPITTRTVNASELETLTLRKKAEGLSGDVRIVYIDGVDSCTCCGTHCQSTGRVGFIRIQDAIRYKGGTRIWLLCGMRAVNAAKGDRAALKRIAVRLSANEAEVVDAVFRQGDELSALKHKLKQRTDELLSIRAKTLLAGAESAGAARLIVHREDGLDAQELKVLADKLRSEPALVAALFAAKEDTLYYQLVRGERASFSMKTLCAAVNAAVGGRGGGRDDMAQGSAKSSPGQDTAIEQLHAYVQNVLKAEA